MSKPVQIPEQPKPIKQKPAAGWRDVKFVAPVAETVPLKSVKPKITEPPKQKPAPEPVKEVHVQHEEAPKPQKASAWAGITTDVLTCPNPQPVAQTAFFGPDSWETVVDTECSSQSQIYSALLHAV